MRIIELNELTEGITFDKPIFIEGGSKIASANTPLKKEDIERLEKWGVQRITTEGNIINGSLKNSDKPNLVSDTSTQDSDTTENKTDELNESFLKRRLLFKEPTKEEKKKFKQLYNNSISDIERIIMKISQNQKINIDYLIHIVDKFVLKVPNYTSFFLNIVHIKSTSNEYLIPQSLNTMIISIIIGHNLKYTSIQLRTLGLTGLLHDVGMFKIPKHIREKERALAPNDINLIKTHTIHTYRLLTNIENIEPEICLAAFQHHERWDGKGYPKKLSGKNIHINARIVAVAQAFCAMIKKRSYRNEKISFNVMREILKNSAKSFDPEIVSIFLNTMAIYPIDSILQLNTGKIGIVVSANVGKPLQPIIKLIFDENSKRLGVPEYINLLDNPDLKIVKVFNPADLGVDVVNEI